MSDYRKFSYGLYEKALPAGLCWQERFEQAGLAGYDFIEFSVDDSDERQARLDWTAPERRQFRSWLKQYGMFAPTMCLSGHHRYPIGSADDSVRKRAMEIMDKALILAEDLGIRVIQLAGYDELEGRPSTPETADAFSRNLEIALEKASRRGIVLAIENMGVPFMDSVEKVMAHVRRLNSPYLQAYPDIGNSSAMGKDVERELSLASGHISAIHIKDTRPGVYRNIPFGEGNVDFEECFKAIRNTGFSGPVVLEMWAGERIDTFEEVRQAKTFVASKMENVWTAASV